ncbi:MAG: hypothetical protein HYY22_01980 [Thaumarchaeota archaeon]|nr:hypothetical protein [Nitrososphaerota archaeon]
MLKKIIVGVVILIVIIELAGFSLNQPNSDYQTHTSTTTTATLSQTQPTASNKVQPTKTVQLDHASVLNTTHSNGQTLVTMQISLNVTDTFPVEITLKLVEADLRIEFPNREVTIGSSTGKSNISQQSKSNGPQAQGEIGITGPARGQTNLSKSLNFTVEPHTSSILDITTKVAVYGTVQPGDQGVLSVRSSQVMYDFSGGSGSTSFTSSSGVTFTIPK